MIYSNTGVVGGRGMARSLQQGLPEDVAWRATSRPRVAMPTHRHVNNVVNIQHHRRRRQRRRRRSVVVVTTRCRPLLRPQSIHFSC